MKFAAIIDDKGNGFLAIGGLNREAIPENGENFEGYVEYGALKHNMDDRCYKIVAYKFTLKTPQEIQVTKDAKTFTDLKEDLPRLIREDYAKNMGVPVVTPLGTFNGGEESAAAINGVIGLGQSLNETTVMLTDISNDPYTFTPAQAITIAALVGKEARRLFFRKQKLMRQVASASLCYDAMAIQLILKESTT